MKKSELKKILKPLVSECIKESLMEDGMISGIIAEVVKGMSPRPPIVETQQAKVDPIQERMKRNAFSPEQSNKLKENKNKLMAAIGGDVYNGINLFEGTTPAPSQQSPTQQAGPMSGQSSDDPGVDISTLFSSAGSHWVAHMNDVEEKE